MKTNKIIYGIILAVMASYITIGCSKQPYFEIPLDENGDAKVTQVTRAESDGIKEGDEQFHVTVEFKNAKAGDVIYVELLSLQSQGDGSDSELLPIAGTQRQFELSTSLSLNVSFTADEAKLKEVGDYVVVTFSSISDSATLTIEMESRVL